MKNTKILFTIAMLLAFIVHAQAQNNTDTLQIQTSAQCGMCKETLEKTMAYEKGVIASSLEMETKVLKVVYKPNRTDAAKIRKAISDAGYDADNVKANERAYSKLPACCKKPDDPDHKKM